MPELRDLFRRHVTAHVQLRGNLIRTWCGKNFEASLETAEIGQNSNSAPLPDVIGELEACLRQITGI